MKNSQGSGTGMVCSFITCRLEGGGLVSTGCQLRASGSAGSVGWLPCKKQERELVYMVVADQTW